MLKKVAKKIWSNPTGKKIVKTIAIVYVTICVVNQNLAITIGIQVISILIVIALPFVAYAIIKNLISGGKK